jgi:phage terminase large subunit-like protein
VTGEQQAQKAIDFITGLKHVKDPWHGCPFDLLPWEDQIVTDIYGTLKKDGTRQYRTAYIEIPKKNGKTELMAALGLKQLCADDEFAAEVYGCASDRGQASLAFDVAVDMVDQEPELRKRIRPILSKHRIVYLPTKSFYQVCSSEAFTKHGLNVSACLFDELHAQPNRDLYDVMSFGSGDARRQPLYFYITTGGRDPERTSVGWEVHEKAENILLGNRNDPTFYPVIYGFDPDSKRIWTGRECEKYKGKQKEAWRDKKIWKLVNPSDGIALREGAIQESYDSCKGNEADELNFQQLRLNIWIKVKTSKWLPLEVWNKNAGIIVPERLKDRKCYGGLDLSGKLDITAFVLLFPPDDENLKWDILPRFWIPEDNMWERVKKDHMPYDKWVKNNKFMLTTPGNVIDYQFIRKEINTLHDSYDIQEIGYDPWNAMQTAIELEDDGFTMMEVRQGYKSMSPPMKEIEALLTGGKMNHGNHPVLNWNFDNLDVKQDENDNVRPVKGRDRNKRIDGIVALINAMNRAMSGEDNGSAYDTTGSILL